MKEVIWVMPDGNEILIGHGVDVRCCFSCACDFEGCPIVPDEWEGGERKSGERFGGVVSKRTGLMVVGQRPTTGDLRG